MKLFLRYCAEENGCAIERLTLKRIDRAFVLSFMAWLERERHSSASTLNQRLACIHTFFRSVQMSYPEVLDQAQQILSIPFRKKPVPAIGYLNADDIKILLSQLDRHTRSGRRDLVLLSLLYDSGARVQELADLTVASLRLEAPAQVSLLGKVSKVRVVPLMKNTVQLLQGYIAENHLDMPHKLQYPLFTNQRHEKLTRAGICYILKKYAILANKSHKHFPDPKSITPLYVNLHINSIFLLHRLTDDCADGVCRILFHLGGGVDVGVEREPCGVVAQGSGEGFYVYAVLERQRGEKMPHVVEADVFRTDGF